jgi:hypothetical protein
MGVRAWLLPLLLVPAVAGLAVSESVRAAPGALPPCTTANCTPVTVSIPPPPPPSPSRPKVWAGITRGAAITEFKKLIGVLSGFHLPGLRAVHALCETFRAWKVWVPKRTARWYIVDERTKGYWATEFAPALGCHP